MKIDTSNFLCIIPARGGSKGIPRKNIKLLNGRPLIYYSIDVARQLTADSNICVSTDDDEIIKVVEDYNLKVPFVRPKELATDTATTGNVLLHAINYYESIGKFFDAVIILQPTSPLRSHKDINDAIALYSDDIDMVTSVKKSSVAAVLCEENIDGFLEMTLNKEDARRQDVKPYYEYNGAVYIINPKSLKEKGMKGFSKIKKIVMDDISSIDIDTPFDWIIAETILEKKLVSL